MLRDYVIPAAAGLLSLCSALAWQWAGGAWTSGWAGREWDAPGHLVSSLVIRQYALDGLPARQPPVKFAYSFYHRFPKVALGHWPPLFHSLLAAWLLAAPLEAPWILAFQALLIGILGGLTTALAIPLLGPARSFLAGCAVCFTAPIVQVRALVMPDVLAAIFVVCGLMAFFRYWQAPGWRSALLFGASLAASLYTKPSGAWLALVPLLFVLLSRNWTLLRRPSFWLLFLPAVLLYGPWHLAFAAWMKEGWTAPRKSGHIAYGMAWKNLRWIAFTAGWAGLPLSLWGIWRLRREPGWRLMAAAAASAFLFFSYIVPVNSLRHYSTLAPVLAIAAAAGIHQLARHFGRFAEPAGWLLFASSLLYFAPGPLPRSGFLDTARHLLRDPAPQVWLVSGHPGIEGDLVAEGALARPSGGLTVYRGSNLFVRSNWSGRRQQALVKSPEDVRALVDRCAIQYAFLGPRTLPVVSSAFVSDPNTWRLLVPASPSQPVAVYQRIGPLPPGLPPPLIQTP